MSCFTCRTSLCCPEHCCDWDTCKCKDCENCGGEKDLKSFSEKQSTQVKSETDVTSSNNFSINHPKKEAEMSIHEVIQLKVQERLKEQREKDAKVQAEYDEKRRIDKARHDEILASSRATIEKNKQVLDSTQETLQRLQTVMNGIKETEQKFKDFQDSFGKIMSQGLERCLGLEENIEELKKQHGTPKESSIEEVAHIIAKANNICILTGAGVSAESGVFTYKDSQET